MKYVSKKAINSVVTVASGVNHRAPKDLRDILVSDKNILNLWNNLTPLARNEWICWVTIYKKSETRAKHLKRLALDLKKGHRRPCCWPGCPHHQPNNKKWFK